MPKKGTFIVIDGSDCSGKETQTKLLKKNLKKIGYKIETIDFPRYQSFYGKMITRYLNGEFGSLDEVNPYLISTLYANDRLHSKNKIENWLKQGKIVIADRYVSANTIFQTAKISSNKEKIKFIKWLNNFEYNINKIPKPDKIIYLYVPVKNILQLSKKRKKSKDIHENNIHFLKEVEKQAKILARKNKKWATINCIKNSQLMQISQINNKILKILIKIIK